MDQGGLLRGALGSPTSCRRYRVLEHGCRLGIHVYLPPIWQPSNLSSCRVELFHPGERAVLDLALEVPADALIDEQKAHDYAFTQGDAISVPEYLVILLQEGILTVTQVGSIFQQLESLHRSTQPFVDWARSQLERLGGILNGHVSRARARW